MTSVIDYVPGDTLLHRLNPVTKLALAAAIIAATLLADTYPLLLALLALTFALAAYAGVAGRLARLLKLVVPPRRCDVCLPAAVHPHGEALWGFVTTDGLAHGP